jgi:transcriptional regulator with XRE-family HTH domain
MIQYNKDVLKQKIEQSGLKTRYLAEEVGISVPSLRAYLKGTRQPSEPVAKLLALKLGIEVTDFYKKTA